MPLTRTHSLATEHKARFIDETGYAFNLNQRERAPLAEIVVLQYKTYITEIRLVATYSVPG